MQRSWVTKFLSMDLSLKSVGSNPVRGGVAERSSKKEAWLCFSSYTEQSSALTQLSLNASSVPQNGIHMHSFSS